MVLDLELHTEFSDHNVVEISTIVCNDSLRDAIPTNKVMLDELGHNIFGNRGERGCFNPLYKVINGDEDKAMSIRGSGFDLSNHASAPHYERPRSSQNVQRY